MKISILSNMILAIIMFLTGCSNSELVEDHLERILPESANVTINKTCTSSNLGIVALLTVTSFTEDTLTLLPQDKGKWIRASSLSEFSETDAQEHTGLGVSGTILDGKNCVRKLTDQAETILFGDKAGWYFTSDDREIVIAIFDEPERLGILFIQAP
jgi:hypothetical protein